MLSSRTFCFLAAATLLLCASAVAAPAEPRTYVGRQKCAMCHQQHAQWLPQSVHAGVRLPNQEADGPVGCEACHGPGSEHIKAYTAETIQGFRDTTPAAERSAPCLNCHEQLQPGELNFRHSDHSLNQVACTDCHASGGSEKFHTMKVADQGMADGQPQLCLSCHASQEIDFRMPSHHPVLEGYMDCTSCHQQHGGFTLRQIRTRGVAPICVNCHEDNQGPFVFEHPPGRAGGCQACLQPHGSPNNKLLNRPQVRFLCLECHPDTPTFHDLTQSKYQNCTLCHSQIHGSNLNRRFFE